MSKTRPHILLMRLSSVGDVILATPIAAHLREARPDARITWLTDLAYLDLIRHNPNIDDAVGFDYTGRHQGPSGIRQLAKELGKIDMLVDLQHKVRTVLLATILRPARRRVLVKRRGFGLIRALVGKDVILKAPHQVERYFNVLGYDQAERASYRLAPPLLRVGEPDQLEADAIVGECERKTPLIGIFPGSRHPNKRWPVRQITSLADRCRRADFSVAILGGEDDESQARAVVDCMDKRPDLVRTGGSLGKLAGIISRCAAVVSPDSGPAHMAAALGVPVVTLFGPTSHERWAPAGPKTRVVRVELPCSPCSNHGGSSCPLGTLECMEDISPEQVWQTLSELIGQSR